MTEARLVRLVAVRVDEGEQHRLDCVDHEQHPHQPLHVGVRTEHRRQMLVRDLEQDAVNEPLEYGGDDEYCAGREHESLAIYGRLLPFG